MEQETHLSDVAAGIVRPAGTPKPARGSTRRPSDRVGIPFVTDVQRPIAIVREADGRRRVREATPVETPKLEVRPRERLEWLNSVVNVTLAVVALVLVSPIMLLVALAVRLTSRGPVIYKQTRVGIDRRQRPALVLYERRREDAGGIVFTIYKFRTMCVDAECGSGAVWARPDDPRVTPVGRILRRTRLDELPQLFNVIKGDMNIVGPRPERPSIFSRLREHIPGYSYRQRTKPGITGWAQINLAYDSSVEDVKRKVAYDLEYLQRRGLAEDMLIMLKTVPVVLFRKGGW